MLVECSRSLSLLSQFSRIFRRVSVTNQFYCTAPKDQETKEVENEKLSTMIDNFRFKYPEFLPPTEPERRNLLRVKLEREDMLKRRNVIYIPEFYVGSVLAVTTSDRHAPKKTVRFVGICISRCNNGLYTTFILRNVIENQGVEVRYSLYSPLIQKIEVLKLEKRLDDELFYLRDAPHEYSTFPFNMSANYLSSKTVPVNTLKVPLNPRPWLQRYERMDLKGVILPELDENLIRKAKLNEKPWEKYDLMDEYRKTVPEEEQKEILNEISEQLKILEEKQKTEKRKKTIISIPKQKLF